MPIAGSTKSYSGSYPKLSFYMIAETAGTYFGEMSDTYDSLIHRAVPRYDEMLDSIIAYAPAHCQNILELGCGSGNLSCRLVQRWPDAAITLVDASAEMVELASARASGVGQRTARLTPLVARFEDLGNCKAPFDVVVSSISLHHVSDKRSLFSSIRNLMSAGGRVLIADQFRGAPDENHQYNWHGWLEFCRLPGNCSEEEVTSLLAHAEAHDHYESIAAHIEYLEAAGFGDIDCVWRNLMWGIVSAMT